MLGPIIMVNKIRRFLLTANIVKAKLHRPTTHTHTQVHTDAHAQVRTHTRHVHYTISFKQQNLSRGHCEKPLAGDSDKEKE